jgi:hypothetical protein
MLAEIRAQRQIVEQNRANLEREMTGCDTAIEVLNRIESRLINRIVPGMPASDEVKVK